MLEPDYFIKTVAQFMDYYPWKIIIWQWKDDRSFAFLIKSIPRIANMRRVSVRTDITRIWGFIVVV